MDNKVIPENNNHKPIVKTENNNKIDEDYTNDANIRLEELHRLLNKYVDY